jgi:hypothetical protein
VPHVQAQAPKPAEAPAPPAAPKQEAKAEKPAPAPPAPGTAFGPSGTANLDGTYDNSDLRRPDDSTSHVIVDFTPEAAAGLEYQAAVASGRCAAFSFVPDPKNGKRINRLYCDPVVAKN